MPACSTASVLRTPGRAMRQRLVAARTDGLRTLVADWKPDENPELDPLLRRLAIYAEEIPPIARHPW